MDNSGLKFSSRRHIIDKERAIGTAKNPKDSHYGRTLLRNNVFEGRLLNCEMGKLGNEARRKQMHLDQQRKLFLKKNLSLPDPMILFERPPSPETLKKASYPEEFTDDDYYFNQNAPHHYMKPRSSHIKGPSTHVIMDMFKTTKKKKFNLWEEVLIEKQGPHFESAVRPSRKLSDLETREIQKAWNEHRRQVESIKPPPPQRTKTQSALSIKPMEQFHMSHPVSAPQGRYARLKDSSKVKSMTFITELQGFEDDGESVTESDHGPGNTANGGMRRIQSCVKGKEPRTDKTNRDSLGLVSVSLSAIETTSKSPLYKSDENIASKVEKTAKDKDNEREEQSKVGKSGVVNPNPKRKGRVIEASKKQKQKLIKEDAKLNRTRACKVVAKTNVESNVPSSKTSSPKSGRRKKKNNFLSILVDEVV